VVVIDQRSRVLLVCSRDPDDGLLVWYTPGGAVELGESLEAAARREIREELRIELGRLEGPVWERVFPHTFAGRHVEAHEWFFLARIEAEQVHVVAETGEGARYFEGWRWWTLRELADHQGIFGPGSLPDLLRSLIEGPVPTSPELLTD